MTAVTAEQQKISIHALREEGDQSGHRLYQRAVGISIHALREEGDGLGKLCSLHLWHFYPRPPRGGRPTVGGGLSGLVDFYPRPPRGGRPLTA